MTWRLFLLLWLVGLCSCGDWPELPGGRAAANSGPWPELLPLSEVAPAAVDEQANDDAVARLQARAAALRSRAARLRQIN